MHSVPCIGAHHRERKYIVRYHRQIKGAKFKLKIKIWTKTHKPKFRKRDNSAPLCLTIRQCEFGSRNFVRKLDCIFMLHYLCKALDVKIQKKGFAQKTRENEVETVLDQFSRLLNRLFINNTTLILQII